MNTETGKHASNVPGLSVVIPTLGRPILIRTLKSLSEAEGFENIEVLVVGVIGDSLVGENLRRLVAEYPQIKHLELSFEFGDSSRKKNAGFDAARAEIVAFLDDDVVVAPNWPLKIVESFSDPEVGLVSAPSLVPDDVSLMARLAGVALASKAAGYVSERYLKGNEQPRQVSWSRLIGCNMAYRRPVLEEIGKFDPGFWPGEEMIAAYQATKKGHILMFHPEAYVYHYPRSSILRFWKQMHGYGATRIRLLRGGVDFEPTTIVPALWVLSLFILGVGAFFSKWFFYLLLVDLALYFIAVLWITFTKVLETRRGSDLLLILVVPFMHLSYGLAEWIELIRPNKDLSEKSG